MTKVRFAFYKAQKGDWFGHAISGYTGFFNWVGSGFKRQPAYCHVEIGLYFDNCWNWYSSASRNEDGSNGTRWLSEAVLFKHPERWDVYEIETDQDVKGMIGRATAEIGKPYDWLGLAGFVTIFGQINDRSKWYCSEVCNYVWSGRWVKRISPIALADVVIKKGAELLKNFDQRSKVV